MRRLPDSPRIGTLLVCVLVCLGIATSIMLTAVHSSLRARRQIARELQMEQTRWLLDAGVARARSQLRGDSGYSGESWEVTPALAAHQTARIEISLGDENAADGSRRLAVTATIRGRDPGSLPTRRTLALLIGPEATGRDEPNTPLETTPDS